MLVCTHLLLKDGGMAYMGLIWWLQHLRETLLIEVLLSWLMFFKIMFFSPSLCKG